MKPLRAIFAILIFALMGVGAWAVFFRKPAEESADSADVATEVVVKSATLTRKTLAETVDAFGLVMPEVASEDHPAAMATLSPPTSSLITEVHCWEGKAVEKGDLLVSLDTRQAQAQLNQAKAAAEFATREFERQKKLVAIEGTSEKTFQSAQNDRDKALLEVAAAETALSLLQVSAPISGLVTMVDANPGETADPVNTLVEIVDPSRLVLSARIPATDASQVKPDQAAHFFRLGNPLDGDGRVIFVNPRVDPANGSVEARISLPPDGQVRLGEWLEVRIVTRTKADVLVAPVESITSPGDEGPVISVIEGETARQIPVKTGIEDHGWVEIEGDGLREGTLIVTEGAYGLPEETGVRILGQ
ncbi:MAG: efflux RND transporter periplasmic adaptor subunit [Verrucomicrobiae bacterium]|nr:efflux RND transporter periplasmic adaptor subunit [Verrucomicrobiae bacterium]